MIDNAHRVPASDVKAIVPRVPHLRLLLLVQPGAELAALEARLAVATETLQGWDEDTIAAAVHDAGCVADFADCEPLSRLTGGLPFYVLNAAAVGAREYGGSIREDWSIAKLGLLIRLFGQLADARILVGFATDEMFHEMGVWPEIAPYLIEIAADVYADPETPLWALDGLVFKTFVRDRSTGPRRASTGWRRSSRRTGWVRTSGWPGA